MVKFRIFSTAVGTETTRPSKRAALTSRQQNTSQANEEEKKNNPQGKEDDNSIDTPTSSSGDSFGKSDLLDKNGCMVARSILYESV
ncbi:17486_t:CDS:2 [Rhizophagus irregularis]|nr:17486_t:CDS:2 [Rhizophagus irregularis]